MSVRDFFRVVGLAWCLSVLPGLLWGTPGVRAVWITRWEFSSPADVRTAMQWLAHNGFNIALFQVRGQGTVYFRSDIEPAAETLSEPISWDPLQVAIEEAHRLGVELHAWVNVFPGWRGERRHSNPRQLWNLHPEWFLLSMDGSREALGGDYLYLTPTLPSVREYLLHLFEEIAARYEIDGLHLDYFRYPGPGYGYDPESVALFGVAAGRSVYENRLDWDEFRRDAITQFLRELRSVLKKNRPEAKLSAAVIGDYRLGRKIFLQDSHQWMSEGLLDLLFPMTYSPDTARFAREVRDHLVDAHRTAVCPGIMVHGNRSIVQEIAIARRLGARGFCFFSYGGLRKLAEQDPQLADRMYQVVRQFAGTDPSPRGFPGKHDPGPRIEHIRLSPAQPSTDGNWSLSCTISDPSGVLLRDVPPLSPYLIWTLGTPEQGGDVALLRPDPTTPDRYRTQSPLPPAPATQPLYLRVFAADRSHENPALCNWNYSTLERYWPVPSRSRWRRAGVLQHVIWGARRIAVDGHGKLWVIEGLRDRLRVFDEDGNECAFSPISAEQLGLPKRERGETLAAIAAHGDSVYVAARGQSARLLILNASDGSPLGSISLDRLPGDLEILPNGAFLATETAGSCWWVFDAAGFALQPPVCTSHLNYGIAFAPHSRSVLATCRSEDVVHIWREVEDEPYLFQEIPESLPFNDISIGDVEVGPDGHIYLCQTAGGLVLELDESFQVVDALGREMRAPLTLALDTSGRRAYVAEAPGIGPERIWIYERD